MPNKDDPSDLASIVVVLLGRESKGMTRAVIARAVGRGSHLDPLLDRMLSDGLIRRANGRLHTAAPKRRQRQRT